MTQTILVTGGAGFIGSHVVKELHRQGYVVQVVDNLCAGHRAALADTPLHVFAAGETSLMLPLLQQHRVDLVMHFAAHIQVGESMLDPGKYFLNNTMQTLQLLECMRQARVMRFVFSSTAAVYGEPDEVPIHENARLKPINPYGESKLMIERILDYYQQIHGIQAMRLRYFNAAGADPDGELGEDHQPESHLIPLVLQVPLGKRDSVSIFGEDYPTRDGTCIRDYIHIADLAQAHILAARALLAGETGNCFNLGNGNGYTVREIIDTARRITGHPIPVNFADRRPGDPPALIAGSDRIRTELGWEPRYPDVESMISHAWQWMQAHPNGYDE